MRSPLRTMLAATVLTALVATGCGNGDDDAAPNEANDTTALTVRENDEIDEDKPVRGGTLTVGLEAETNSWLPSEARLVAAGYTVMYSIFDPLMTRTADGTVVPYLASSLEPNDDFTVWTLTLRDGVTFHDGTSLTSEVLKANFDEYLTVPGAVSAASYTGVTMEVTGPLTVEYRLEARNAAFADKLTGSMPFSIEAARAAGDDAGSMPVGTGPFRFVSWTRDGELRVERWDDYWRTDEDGEQLPYLDAVVFRPIPDEDSRLASMQSGTVSVMQTARQSIVRQLRVLADGDDPIETYEWVGNNGTSNIMNVLQPPVDDLRIRRALVMGAEQSQLIDVLGGADISPAQTQYFSIDSPWYSAEVAEAYPGYDPDAAAALVQDYADDPERSDGKAPGEPVVIEYFCPPDPSLLDLSQAYQGFWQQIGLEVQLGTLEQAAHVDRAIGLSTDPPFKGDFMVQCWRSGGESDPGELFAGGYGPWESTPTNVTNFSHPGILEAVETLRSSDEFEVRKAAVEQIGLILTDQVPVSWSGSTAYAVGASSRVHGLTTWTAPGGEVGTGVTSSIIRTVMTWID